MPLRFDGVVPDAINAQFLAEAGQVEAPAEGEKIRRVYRQTMTENRIPEVNAGTPLADAYDPESAIGKLLDLPLVRGALKA